jgi:hypothetical protein
LRTTAAKRLFSLPFGWLRPVDNSVENMKRISGVGAGVAARAADARNGLSLQSLKINGLRMRKPLLTRLVASGPRQPRLNEGL